jgi:hypothetical protein
MRKERPFEIAKARTAKGVARVRERVTMDAMGTLAAILDEDEFRETLNRLYQINPGEPRYEAALRAWREVQASQRPHR